MKALWKRKTIRLSKQFKISAMVLIFVLASTCVYNMLFMRGITQEREVRRQREAEGVASAVSSEYEPVELMIRHLALSPQVEGLLYGASPNDLTMDKYKALINTLDLIHINQNQNVLVYVLFHNTDTVVGMNGKMSMDVFLKQYKFAPLADEMRQASSKKAHIVTDVAVYSPTDPYISRQAKDQGTLFYYTRSGVTVMAVVQNQPVLDRVQTLLSDGKSAFYILDEELKTLLASDEAAVQYESEQALMEEIAQKWPGRTPIAHRQGRYTAYLVDIQEPYSLQGQRANTFLWVTVTISVVFLLLIFFAMRREIFLPMGNILEKISANTPPVGDEYRIIDAAIGNMKSQISDLTRQNHRRAQDDQMKIFNQVLLGVDLEWAAGGDRPGESGAYALVSVMDEGEGDMTPVCALLKEHFAARLVVGFPHNKAYVVALEGGAWPGALLEAVRQLSPNRVAVGVSRAHERLQEIRDAYEEVNRMLDAPVEGCYLLYGAGQEGGGENASGLPLNWQSASALVSAVSSRDAQAACQIIEDILGACGHCSINQLRQLAAYLLGFLQIAGGPDWAFADYLGRARRLLFKDSMAQMLQAACADAVGGISASKEDQLVQFVKDYVEGHYAENIYLKSIAEQAGYSYAYVSHCFSTRTGESFVDYLNGFRIEKAKLLLINTSAPIATIAELAGFGSTNTFIRNMKKYEGVTPDAFRKLFSRQFAVKNENMVE